MGVLRGDRYIQRQVYKLFTTKKTSTECQISFVSAIYANENYWSIADQIILIVKAIWITFILFTNCQAHVINHLSINTITVQVKPDYFMTK